jgi:hypothetical protein
MNLRLRIMPESRANLTLPIREGLPTIRPKPDWDLSHRRFWTTASRFRVPSSGTQSNTEARWAESTRIRVALVPFGGLLVSMREAKNSGFTSRWTADLHPDRQAFSSETFLLCTSSAAPERVSDERLALLATG